MLFISDLTKSEPFILGIKFTSKARLDDVPVANPKQYSSKYEFGRV